MQTSMRRQDQSRGIGEVSGRRMAAAIFNNRFHQCLLASVAVFLLAALAFAADPDAQETFDSGTQGWTRFDPLNQKNGSVVNSGGALQLTFGKQAIQVPQVYIVQAWSNASSAAFVGDYWATAITSMTFKVNCQGYVPADLELYIFSRSTSNWWYRRLGAPTNTNGWSSYNVPVQYSTAWSVGGGGTSKKFKDDLKSILWVGLQFQRNDSMEKQDYKIDDFKINGASKSQDSDGDGLTDWAEFMSGSDPMNANSRLELSTVAKPEEEQTEGVTLKWPSEPNRKYAVRRTSDLSLDFPKIASDIESTPPVNTYTDETATGDGPYFYKIEVEE